MPGVVLMGQALIVGAYAKKKVIFQMRKSHKLLLANRLKIISTDILTHSQRKTIELNMIKCFIISKIFSYQK